MPKLKAIGGSPALYRGPVRKKRILVGSAPNIPVPIARINARIQPNTGIVAKSAPSLDRSFKKYNVGREAGAV